MKTQTVLLAVAAVAVANVALAYFNRGRPPGQNKLLDLNDSLAKINPLSLLFPPQPSPGPTVVGPTTFAPAPVAQVTDQSGGTTTYWGG